MDSTEALRGGLRDAEFVVRLSWNPTEQRIGASSRRWAMACATALESIPPERKAPSGTSATSRSSTTRSTQSGSPPARGHCGARPWAGPSTAVSAPHPSRSRSAPFRARGAAPRSRRFPAHRRDPARGSRGGLRLISRSTIPEASRHFTSLPKTIPSSVSAQKSGSRRSRPRTSRGKIGVPAVGDRERVHPDEQGGSTDEASSIGPFGAAQSA